MNTWIAFLRGINVGGKNRFAMKDLKALMENSGFFNVQTYIQSGNIVFESENTEATEFVDRIAGAIEDARGFRPSVVVLSASELRAAAEGNPFGEGEAVEKLLHIYFLAAKPSAPNLDAIEAAKTESESCLLKGRYFYLYTPDGFGRSKLAQRVEKLLGVPATARNWRTVTMMRELAGA